MSYWRTLERSGVIRAAAGGAIFMAVCAANAQTLDGDAIAYIAKAPIAGLPAGNYAQWTEEQRAAALKRIGGFCEFMCVDSYGAAGFTSAAEAERAKAEAKFCLAACIVAHLPPDYPQLAGMKTDLRADFDKAKALGSALKWPLPPGR
jgi:hypothetical protein